MNITIPPEALERGARRIYTRFGANAGPFDEAPSWIRQQCENEARAAFLAILEAWPGMRHRPEVPSLHASPAWPGALILPLTEKTDE